MHCVKTVCSRVLATYAGFLRFLMSSLIDERDSDCFISRFVECSSSDSSYCLTDLSMLLVTIGYQLRFLALHDIVLNLLIWHAHGTITLGLQLFVGTNFSGFSI